MTGHQLRKTNIEAVRSETDREALTRIEEQGRQTLELVKALIGLLMPKEGVREGPSLEDLLSALIMQQREAITIAKANQESLGHLGDTLPLAVAEAVAEQIDPKRAVRA